MKKLRYFQLFSDLHDSKSGDVEKVEQCFENMLSEGVEPDSKILSGIVQGFCAAGKLDVGTFFLICMDTI